MHRQGVEYIEVEEGCKSIGDRGTWVDKGKGVVVWYGVRVGARSRIGEGGGMKDLHWGRGQTP